MKKKFFSFFLAITVLVTLLGGGISSASAAATGEPTPQKVELNMSLVKNGPKTTPSTEQKGIIGSLIKKLATKLLRFSAPYVKKGLAKVIGEKWAKKASQSFYKVADFIEKAQKIEEHAIAQIFIAGGLPPDIAYQAARYLVLLLPG
ncbi:hypothetical protein ERICIV_03766 [Paenibacillus larvae subsp. larvae]|uniref:Secreted protein n=1 Tax=Paenibacillus larvae subsp. larvae TaxID=147375 RepID=A0A2L1UI40_9BACL|nr:hypothetical protein [Paenibacillus larvae]AQT84422.1 hypothetical protein B1222_08490 [Paenibacillus larvae subsp. pulvifaciens]AQZ46416.1 hypothetical protein B5S25_07065 [Paenibacillus larvae subsp. pulvifaciens]AVF28106.1 hypothetical protein ERICIII_04023 [Paenibacillus larvae subsp. larvae]AVF32609.1 hypothetical protein ERICIV_03766 [Paenibacillus larvae subsp. larvae]MBH0343879.1 hypothetical protein [Paenibacillus larvae]